ncbi:hypothetical protein SteCoe_25565 [Stentor coeruleus]|uniref:Uncharacterized protein n=1 Tax=Stentor coeruleus TaxID=5963 RepID=A0A1R2BF06_9CILI|nr:hypothetical protein SteCoe_25565 [Stentor coeruleus]
MYKLEAKEKFWNSKVEDFANKIKNLSRSQQETLQTKSILSKKEATYEELRLLNDLSNEEIQELKTLLSSEKNKTDKLTVKVETLKVKIQELEKNNKSLTNLLIERGSKLFNSQSPREIKDYEKLKEEHKECAAKIKKEEEMREIIDGKAKKLQLQIFEQENEILRYKEVVNKLESDKNFIEQEMISKNSARISELVNKNKELENHLESIKHKHSTTPNTISDLNEKLKILEEENMNLKEQVEIYQEDQSKKINESNLLKKLSYMILSKDSSSLDQEASKILKKAIGENSTNLIETFQEKAFNFEQENKQLSQRVNQEIKLRIENLEKIKNLQEMLSKIVNEPGLELDIGRTKIQIATAKNSLASLMNRGQLFDSFELIEKNAELEIFRTENQNLHVENQKMKEEYYRYINLISELENKLNFYESTPVEADIINFIQCEAAALEDMLAESVSPELDSEELY